MRVEQRLQVGGSDVVDEERHHGEREIRVREAAPSGERRGVDLRITLGNVQAAVGREALEQDRGEAASRRFAARAHISHARSSLRMRTIFASTVGSACIFGDRRRHATLDGVVRQDDDVGARLACAGGVRPLQQRVDRDAVLGEDAGDPRQHAGLVGDLQAQVEGGDDVVDRQDAEVLHRRRLEREMRNAVVGVGGGEAGDVDQVGDHRRRGRLGACALAVVERRADGVALHHHRVHRAFDVGDQTPRRHQRRMNAQLDATGLGRFAALRLVIASSLIR